jgi:hypothetical protein
MCKIKKTYHRVSLERRARCELLMISELVSQARLINSSGLFNTSKYLRKW